jgi:membrane-bound ClpP family serine protease
VIRGQPVARARTFNAVGVALLVLGAAFVAFGLSDGRSTFRISGPVLAFFGIVLLVQARRRG